jgi:hypothetical protein
MNSDTHFDSVIARWAATEHAERGPDDTHCPMCGEGYPPGRSDADFGWQAIQGIAALIAEVRRLRGDA